MSLRIGGVNIPEKKHIVIGLQEIRGIGKTRAKDVCAAAGIPESKKGFEITPEEEAKLREAVSQYTIEGDLRRKEAQDKARLKGIQCFRALRHLKRLPCRGQRTRTNAQTASRV